MKLELKLLKPFTDLVYLIGFKSYDLVKFKKTRVGKGSSRVARKSRVVSFDSTHYAQVIREETNFNPPPGRVRYIYIYILLHSTIY